ncbi:MAG: YkgJ family cysteine cluster protein [Nitrospirota bacterium]
MLFYILLSQEVIPIKKSRKVSKLLKMHCGQCGSCCIDPVIELTDNDIKRLVKHTGLSADRLIRLYSKSDFTTVNDTEDWINLSYGKRQLGLRKKKDGTCLFLSDDRKCTAYEARPMACRVFPIDVYLDEKSKVTDLELSDVVRDKFIKCKQYYGKPNSFILFRQKADQSGKETASFCRKIKQWNSKDDPGGKDDFLDFLGL